MGSKGKRRQVVEGRVVIQSNLAELMSQKAKRDGKKKLTAYRVSLETGVALNTVKRWLYEAPDSFNNDVVSAFCEYFGCEVGDLLKTVDVGETTDTKD